MSLTQEYQSKFILQDIQLQLEENGKDNFFIYTRFLIDHILRTSLWWSNYNHPKLVFCLSDLDKQVVKFFISNWRKFAGDVPWITNEAKRIQDYGEHYFFVISKWEFADFPELLFAGHSIQPHWEQYTHLGNPEKYWVQSHYFPLYELIWGYQKLGIDTH